jgi:hypothetical protein
VNSPTYHVNLPALQFEVCFLVLAQSASCLAGQ